MTLYVVALDKQEAAEIARMTGHYTRAEAEEHLRQVKESPTDTWYAAQYKVFEIEWERADD